MIKIILLTVFIFSINDLKAMKVDYKSIDYTNTYPVPEISFEQYTNFYTVKNPVFTTNDILKNLFVGDDKEPDFENGKKAIKQDIDKGYAHGYHYYANAILKEEMLKKSLLNKSSKETKESIQYVHEGYLQSLYCGALNADNDCIKDLIAVFEGVGESELKKSYENLLKTLEGYKKKSNKTHVYRYPDEDEKEGNCLIS